MKIPFCLTFLLWIQYVESLDTSTIQEKKEHSFEDAHIENNEKTIEKQSNKIEESLPLKFTKNEYPQVSHVEQNPLLLRSNVSRNTKPKLINISLIQPQIPVKPRIPQKISVKQPLSYKNVNVKPLILPMVDTKFLNPALSPKQSKYNEENHDTTDHNQFKENHLQKQHGILDKIDNHEYKHDETNHTSESNEHYHVECNDESCHHNYDHTSSNNNNVDGADSGKIYTENHTKYGDNSHLLSNFQEEEEIQSTTEIKCGTADEQKLYKNGKLFYIETDQISCQHKQNSIKSENLSASPKNESDNTINDSTKTKIAVVKAVENETHSNSYGESIIDVNNQKHNNRAHLNETDINPYFKTYINNSNILRNLSIDSEVNDTLNSNMLNTLHTRQGDRENVVALNFRKSSEPVQENKNNDAVPDVVIKENNMDEIIHRYKYPEPNRNQMHTRINDYYGPGDKKLTNPSKPQNVFFPEYNFQDIEFVPNFSNQGVKYSATKNQRNTPPQEYYFNTFGRQVQNYPRMLYSNDQFPVQEWSQNYYPKSIKLNSSPKVYEYDFSKPDYSYTPPSFKYPCDDQLRDTVWSNIKYPRNNMEAIETNTPKPPCSYYKSWYPNSKNNPRLYNNNNPSNMQTYNELHHPDKYFDKIWRSWRTTEVHIKDLKNQRKSLQNELDRRKLDKEKLNKRPSTTFNQGKRVMNGNGCY